MVVFLWALRSQSTQLNSIQFTPYYYSEREERERRNKRVLGEWDLKSTHPGKKSSSHTFEHQLWFSNYKSTQVPTPSFFFPLDLESWKSFFLLFWICLCFADYIQSSEYPTFWGRQAGRKFLLADVFVRNLTIKVLSLQFMYNRTVGCWGFWELQHNLFVFFFPRKLRDTHSLGSEILGASLFLALRFICMKFLSFFLLLLFFFFFPLMMWWALLNFLFNSFIVFYLMMEIVPNSFFWFGLKESKVWGLRKA